MKTIFKLIPLVSVAVFGACNDIIESTEAISIPEKEIVLTATREGVNPGTKSFRLDDGSVWWSPAEEVSVFYGSGSSGGSKFVSMNTAIAETVELQGSVQMAGSGKDFWAVYPYSEENSCDGNSITTVIPDQQTGVEGNFSNDAFPTVAKSSSLSLAFWNICGGVKFFVSRSDIKSVTFKGNNNEPLAGKVRVSFGIDGTPVVQEVIDAKAEVTLVAPEGGAFKPGKYYYVTLLPKALDSGFTITFSTEKEKGELVSDKAQTIKRSTFGVLKNVDSKVSNWESTVVEPEWVDLGLSVKWATMNVGATKLEEYGDYFAWGETKPKTTNNWSTYKFELGTDYKGPFSKYVTNSSYGTVDNKTVLDPEDDAAHVNWGGSWRMPTDAEWTELRTKCTWTWTTQNGVNGRKVTGPNGNSIFLPAAGRRGVSSLFFAGSYGLFWSSSLNTGNPYRAWYVDFYSDDVGMYDLYRCYGQSVRPVYGEFVIVSSISLDKTSLDLCPGDSEQLTTSIIPANATAKDVHWESSDTSVANVDKDGIVAAVAVGSATITAYASSGVSTSCEVTVSNTIETIEDFAKEYVKILDIWEKTTGTVDYVMKSDAESINPTSQTLVENAHYVPMATTITVGGKTYNTADMLELALRSFLLLRGYDGNETEKNGFGNIPKFNPLPMSAPVPETHNYYFGNYPYAEPSNGGYLCKVDGDKEIYRQVEVRILDNWAQRSVNFQHGQSITNMCTYPRADHNITDYKGCFSAMRALITYAHFFKYMLDNNLEKADGIEGSQIIRSELFGVEHQETEPLAVDLGLSVKWATFNVGATKPEEYGDYFAWGETKPKTTNNWSTYKLELGTDYKGPFSKYVTKSSYGMVDNKTVLDPGDDAAHEKWGGSWRMPTDAEWTELRTKCTWTWTTQNGVKGRKVTGPNGNSIFLPAAGNRGGTYLNDAGSFGYYWSSSLNTGNPYDAWSVYFYSGDVGRDYYCDRCYGQSVRPVTE